MEKVLCLTLFLAVLMMSGMGLGFALLHSTTAGLLAAFVTLMICVSNGGSALLVYFASVLVNKYENRGGDNVS